jgi:hypothetical protein
MDPHQDQIDPNQVQMAPDQDQEQLLYAMIRSNAPLVLYLILLKMMIKHKMLWHHI